MGRRALVTALALAAAALFAGPASGDAGVTIKNISFQPSDVTIHTGESVTWTHMDGSTPHSVTSNTGAFDSSPNCNPSTGIGCMTQGNTYRVMFSQPGSFPYHCKVHSSMNGTITVAAPAPPPTQPAPAPQPAPTAAPVTRAPAPTAAPTTAAPTTIAAPSTTVVAAAEQSTTSSTTSGRGGQALATKKTSSGDGVDGGLAAVAAVLLALVAGGGLFYRRRLS